MLHALGWPVYDTEVVAPEFVLSGRRVDYALCHPPRDPVVMVEVKQVGQSKGADRQLFEYAFHKGVPMAVLTDGQEWHFFLPTEQGDYGERRVYKLDLLERAPEEAQVGLERYLGYGEVRSGRAIEAARRDYRDAARKRMAQRTLPEAWTRLVEAEDELLIELLSDKVEDLCGVKPDPDAVAAFLRRQNPRTELPPGTVPRRAERPTRPASDTPNASRSIGYKFDGSWHQARSAREVMVGVFEELAKRDPRFPERFAALPKHGRKRRYIARTREELYPGSPHLASNALQLRSGWWVDAHASRSGIERRIKMACEVARVGCGEDLQINLG